MCKGRVELIAFCFFAFYRDLCLLIGVDGGMDRGKGGNARLYRDGDEELSLRRLMALLGAGYFN